MHKFLFYLIALGVGACSSLPPIKDQPDTIKLSARVIKVVLPVPHFPSDEISYVPVNGVVVPVLKSPRPVPTFTDDYRYTLAVAGHGETEIVLSRQFSLGQCLLIYVRPSSVGKAYLPTDEAAVEESMHAANDCPDDGSPSRKK